MSAARLVAVDLPRPTAAAVDAAAKALCVDDWMPGDRRWEDLAGFVQQAYRDDVTRSLQAAHPQTVADVLAWASAQLQRRARSHPAFSEPSTRHYQSAELLDDLRRDVARAAS